MTGEIEDFADSFDPVGASRPIYMKRNYCSTKSSRGGLHCPNKASVMIDGKPYCASCARVKTVPKGSR